MTRSTQDLGDGFVVGLLAGTALGACLTMWLAPGSATQLRQRLESSASALGKRASEQYHAASDHVTDTVGKVARQGAEVRDGVADAVIRGAQHVERVATAAKV